MQYYQFIHQRKSYAKEWIYLGCDVRIFLQHENNYYHGGLIIWKQCRSKKSTWFLLYDNLGIYLKFLGYTPFMHRAGPCNNFFPIESSSFQACYLILILQIGCHYQFFLWNACTCEPYSFLCCSIAFLHIKICSYQHIYCLCSIKCIYSGISWCWLVISLVLVFLGVG